MNGTIEKLKEFDEVKIRKMKQEGKMYSIDTLYQLLQVVNSHNIIHLNNSY